MWLFLISVFNIGLFVQENKCMANLTTDLSKFDNSWFNPGGPLKRLIWYFFNLLFLRSGMPFSGLKVFLLRLFGARIGSGVVIKPHVNIKYPWKLSIDDNCWVGENVWIDNLGEVLLGKNVCLSQGAMLLCGNHDFSKVSFDLIVKNITLEEGVWIGAQSVVCPGVICRSHSVLAVGSVATKELDAYSIYQGNPAIKIKDRELLP
jgi:putative colanic acid biosynthesis acetyltransferase WcaF